MLYKKVKLTAILLLGLRLAALHAQEAIPASGGNASGSGGTVSYTIGQVAYTNHSGSGGTITQGVQQPYEILVISGNENNGIDLICSAYPNPVTNYLTLKIVGGDQTMYSATLYDMSGKILLSKKTEGILTAIYMDNFVQAMYILKVTDSNNKEIKIFKIIKY